MPSLAHKFRNAPWLVFALVFAWKIALFAFSAQPVPSDDAFFYDGPVVNKLLGGGYFNPSIAPALPISGTQVFSAYPPLYQAALWGWMNVFGTSVISAMAMHLVLFGCYLLVVLAILRRLHAPFWCFHFAGLFLLVLTFHDRPDSLAHVFGMLAVYSWLRSRGSLSARAPDPHANRWTWLMVLFAIATLCTSLQIGAIYFLWVWVGMLATVFLARERFPLIPMSVMTLVPIALVALVKFQFPHLWAGFLEHARQTPSLTGWRVPYFEELLKVARNAPGILLVAVLFPLTWLKRRNAPQTFPAIGYELFLISALTAALVVVVACLVLVTANMVAIAGYLQPLVVAAYLAWCAANFTSQRPIRLQAAAFALAALLGSIRAIGMTTWGLACAADVGYPSANRRIESELANRGTNFKVVMSGAYLYGASTHRDITLIHSDWMEPAKSDPPISDLQALVALRPQKLILTQFDYYRRYQAVLEKAKAEPSLKNIQVVNTATTRAPDSYHSLQKVVQHISWAPVIVDLTWQDAR
ncbi:MAG: hypothetical protein JWR26_1964 [Pedosphaera sp.]|nr:hypothetical protein [Pedosphaera sp.]